MLSSRETQKSKSAKYIQESRRKSSSHQMTSVSLYSLPGLMCSETSRWETLILPTPGLFPPTQAPDGGWLWSYSHFSLTSYTGKSTWQFIVFYLLLFEPTVQWYLFSLIHLQEMLMDNFKKFCEIIPQNVILEMLRELWSF